MKDDFNKQKVATLLLRLLDSFASLGLGSGDAYLSVLLQCLEGAVWLGTLLQRVVSGGQQLVALFLGITQFESFEIAQRCTLQTKNKKFEISLFGVEPTT